jgi:hypothetical protein
VLTHAHVRVQARHVAPLNAVAQSGQTPSGKQRKSLATYVSMQTSTCARSHSLASSAADRAAALVRAALPAAVLGTGEPNSRTRAAALELLRELALAARVSGADAGTDETAAAARASAFVAEVCAAALAV